MFFMVKHLHVIIHAIIKAKLIGCFGKIWYVQTMVKPLSHQGGVLMVFPRRPYKLQNVEVRAVRPQPSPQQRGGKAVASPLDTVDHIERRATVRTLSMLKTNVVAQGSHGVLIRAQLGHRKIARAAQ